MYWSHLLSSLPLGEMCIPLYMYMYTTNDVGCEHEWWKQTYKLTHLLFFDFFPHYLDLLLLHFRCLIELLTSSRSVGTCIRGCI